MASTEKTNIGNAHII